MFVFPRKPATTFQRIHEKLIKEKARLMEDDQYLFVLFEDIFAEMHQEDCTDKSLHPSYLYAYYSYKHELNYLVGPQEVGKMLQLSTEKIKEMAQKGKIVATTIGDYWVFDKRNMPASLSS